MDTQGLYTLIDQLEKLNDELTVNVDQRVIEHMIETKISEGNNEQACKLIEKYCWNKSKPDMDKYESVYLNTYNRYVILAYNHKPCPKFKAKYPTFCTNHGLE